MTTENFLLDQANFEKKEKLDVLINVLTPYTKNLPVNLDDKPADDKPKESQYSEDKEKRKAAAKVILRAWRGNKITQSITSSPYFSYLSMLDPQDEKRLMLSALMYGRHVAEIASQSEYYINNPFIPTGAKYHRNDNKVGRIMELFCQKLGIESVNPYKLYIPISLLENCTKDQLMDSAIKFIQQESDWFQLEHLDHEIIVHPNQQVGVLVLDPYQHYESEKIKTFMESSGFIASPWQLAETVGDMAERPAISNVAIPIMPDLPGSKELLLKSKMFNQLLRVSSNEKYPTHLLAKSLVELLKNLPEDTDEKTIQRIALMTELANAFYAFNYTRYAFFVATIIHEVSLKLALDNQSPEALEEDFTAFTHVSQTVFQEALGLGKTELEAVSVVSMPALSGTNAYFLAQEIAKKITSVSDPVIAAAPHEYFEINNLIPEDTSTQPTILLLSAGPIVDGHGLNPGKDINKFVQNYVIDPQRTEPLTLIVDTTTALNKDLNLSPEVKKLIESGQLSIIVFESFQKFGLLHSDQAQVGRLVAFCSKKHYSQEELARWMANAKKDFSTHLDMRIAAYLHIYCAPILEEIKHKHFDNGEIFRTILAQTAVINEQITSDTSNLNTQNYFVAWRNDETEQNFKSILDFRDSFGHFAETTSLILGMARLSPGASDALDALITASQLYLDRVGFRDKDPLLTILNAAATWDKLNLKLEHRIIIMAVLAIYLAKHKDLVEEKELPLLEALLAACPQFKGRQIYTKIYQDLEKLKQDFNYINSHKEQLKSELVKRGASADRAEQIISNFSLAKIAVEYRFLRPGPDFFKEIDDNPNAYENLKKIMPYLKNYQDLLTNLANLNVNFTPTNLEKFAQENLFNKLSALFKSGVRSSDFYNFLLSGTYQQAASLFLDHMDFFKSLNEKQAQAITIIGTMMQEYFGIDETFHNGTYCEQIIALGNAVKPYIESNNNPLPGRYFLIACVMSLNKYYKADDKDNDKLKQELEEHLKTYVNALASSDDTNQIPQARKAVNFVLEKLNITSLHKSNITFFGEKNKEVSPEKEPDKDISIDKFQSP
ncbi:hypothetical protein [Legionella quateirensis]|uniref:Uncharacterized protein n=1 Tax=Legionella quateirensis TaxID=45072 RepID=A0A378KR85_9GAMM|nr:hypothetical protein [Legionella quateirensis]KTD47776.1 hypothetical protein Lqua_2169 [Legionella quateirensis]STY16669.1 Uncharacterised protein [Legionella quateirensis]